MKYEGTGSSVTRLSPKSQLFEQGGNCTIHFTNLTLVIIISQSSSQNPLSYSQRKHRNLRSADEAHNQNWKNPIMRKIRAGQKLSK